MNESKESRLETRIDELALKKSIYDEIISHVEFKIADNLEGSVGKETYTKILNQLASQRNQIGLSRIWHQKALQNLQNQQPQPSQ